MDDEIPAPLLGDSNPVVFTFTLRGQALDDILEQNGIVPNEVTREAFLERLEAGLYDYMTYIVSQLQKRYDLN